MKCPYCGYSNGEHVEAMLLVKAHSTVGRKGDFYTLPITMQRKSKDYSWQDDARQLVGCPECDKVFMY